MLDAAETAKNAAESSAAKIQKEMEDLRKSMLAQEEVNTALKSRIETVVGTFEQTKREEAAQWEKSLLESEKLMDEMDDEAEMKGIGGSGDTTDDGQEDLLENKSGKEMLNVADAGFPGRDESEA